MRCDAPKAPATAAPAPATTPIRPFPPLLPLPCEGGICCYCIKYFKNKSHT